MTVVACVYRYQLAEHEQNECPHRPVDMKFDNIIKKYAREMEMKDKAHTAEMKYTGTINLLCYANHA